MPTARIRLVLEVEAGSNWTKDTTMDQIYKQALGETKQKLEGLLTNGFGHSQFSIIGTPEVIAVYNTMKEKPQ